MVLRQYRKEKNLTQEELAELVGVTQEYVCALERGKKQNPSVGLLVKIAKVLEVSTEELLQDYA